MMNVTRDLTRCRPVTDILFVFSVFVLMGIGACDGSDDDESGVVVDIVVESTKMITASGGTVSAGGASAEIPSEAFSADTSIAVGVKEVSTGFAELPNEVTEVTKIFEFTPHGQTFDKPTKVRVPIPADANPENLILVKSQPGGDWVQVAGATVVGNHLEANVTSFSFFRGVDGELSNLDDGDDQDNDFVCKKAEESCGKEIGRCCEKLLCRDQFCIPESLLK